MSKKKLGLDLGTNSIGWAVLEKQDGKYDFLEVKDNNNNPIPTKGSYIFPKGVNADENSKAAERRGFRGARRRLERIIKRKIATLKVLNEFDLCPSFDEGELNKWKNKRIYPTNNEKFIEWQRTGKKNGNSESERLKQPYYLRHLAATKEGLMDFEQGRLQLGRAFYHLAQRRGYLSNGDDEQSEDKLDLFKAEVLKLLEETESTVSFIEPYSVIFDNRKGDKKVVSLGNKIKKELKKEIDFEKIKTFIIAEFDKPENLGKVMKSIGELSDSIQKSGQPTMGSYFYSIYATADKKTGLISKIRGRYIHREEHYLKEFNFICEKQNITGQLREKLYNAIFYQRPLKSQKGLVAKCPLEPKRKRIAVSHPLFEEFRMWESINRIKVRNENQNQLDFLTLQEKEMIKPLFLQKTDFEFQKIASKLSGDKTYCYVKEPNKVFFKGSYKAIEGGVAELFFNFPMDKKFSACPTTSSLIKLLGNEKYNQMHFLNSGYNNEKGKKEVSIEDIWHCLFLDTFGKKDRNTIRKEFAENHLLLNEKGIEDFQKIKLSKGYGNLSKAALKKIVPFLKRGEIYSHAVFLANISEVLNRTINTDEQKIIAEKINEALELHKIEKRQNGIVNNYISKVKDSKNESLGNNSFSIEVHKKELIYEIINWIGESEYNNLKEDELENTCWTKFAEAALDKSTKEISYLSTKKIPEFIAEKLKEAFPNDKIEVSKLYHPSAMEAYPKADKKLGNPEISSIKNPVFNRSMHQIKRLCNELIRKGIIDKDTEVNVEVAREVNSASYRKALSLWQKEQEIIRDWAKQEIINTYPKDCQKEINPTDTDIVKYIFWKEQNHQCIYTGKQISICEFLGGKSTYDIEHTVPRSKFHDNSLSNKTLADTEFNRSIKKDILPGLLNENFKGLTISMQNVLNNRNANLKSYSLKNNVPTWSVGLKSLKDELKKYKTAARATSDPISHSDFMTKVHYTKIKLDYLSKKYKNFECDEVQSKFTNANLVVTRIIAKYARAYLNSYFNKVNVVNGKITDTLRKMWGLEDEYAVKDRSNHIHHCIDAVTVACVERGTANWISEAFHKFESDYFKGNRNPKYKIKQPMDDFANRMHNLYKEVFIYHRQIDRIKPFLIAVEKGIKTKQNLRGKLNSQNPYAQIKKNDELIFAKREPITKLTGGDIDNIIDDGIKVRLLKLADKKGWEKLMEFPIKEGEDFVEKEMEHKKGVAFRVFEKIKKADKKKEIVNINTSKDVITSDFSDIDEFIAILFISIIKPDIEEKKRENYKEKIIKEAINLTRTKGLETLLKESEGVIVLPEYYDEKKKKQIGRMVIKNIRLRSSKSNLKDYKEIRAIDKSKFEYKRDYYFDKDSYTNYEARIYGNLIPDENGKLKNREYKLINHYNIVKNIFEEETKKPLLKLHQDDMFLVFDRNPNDEIIWENKKDLQNRLFKIVKFNENGIIVLERHNYALGNVNSAKPLKTESDLSDMTEVVLRRSPSTLKVIPAKLDTLGNLDINYSQGFI